MQQDNDFLSFSELLDTDLKALVIIINVYAAEREYSVFKAVDNTYRIILTDKDGLIMNEAFDLSKLEAIELLAKEFACVYTRYCNAQNEEIGDWDSK